MAVKAEEEEVTKEVENAEEGGSVGSEDKAAGIGAARIGAAERGVEGRGALLPPPLSLARRGKMD